MKPLNPYFNNVLVNLTVKCMLNPNNKHFYIGTLTLEKAAEIVNGISDCAETFWTAYHIASKEYNEQVELEKARKAFEEDFAKELAEIQAEVEAYEAYKKEINKETCLNTRW
jgi:hypothetical protein